MSENTATPYHLCWSIQQYKDFGAKLGFDFDTKDFQRAPSNECILGTKRYLPEEDAPVELGFPLGVLVRCYLIPTIGVDSPMLDVNLENLISHGDKVLVSLAERASANKENVLITPSNTPAATVTPR